MFTNHIFKKLIIVAQKQHSVAGNKVTISKETLDTTYGYFVSIYTDKFPLVVFCIERTVMTWLSCR